MRRSIVLNGRTYVADPWWCQRLTGRMPWHHHRFDLAYGPVVVDGEGYIGDRLCCRCGEREPLFYAVDRLLERW